METQLFSPGNCQPLDVIPTWWREAVLITTWKQTASVYKLQLALPWGRRQSFLNSLGLRPAYLFTSVCVCAEPGSGDGYASGLADTEAA